ncbi:MAG: hypothetical protein PUF12_12075 [Thermoflexaceae bacterium]|nr:hypothetical protein [Thermoflexaceae bacterium]
MIDPVMSIMLYWGKGKWNAPSSIRGMQSKSGLPNNVVSCLSDYIVHVINVREITQEEMEAMESDLKHVIALLKAEDDKEAYRRYIMENREYFENVPDSTIMLIDALLKQRMKQMLKSREERESDEAKDEQLKKETIEGEERFNMCALDELIKDGYDSGVNDGEERLGKRLEKLSLILINMNKMEELKKVVTDKEYRDSLFEAYGI